MCVQALEKGVELAMPDEKVRHKLGLGLKHGAKPSH